MIEHAQEAIHPYAAVKTLEVLVNFHDGGLVTTPQGS